MEPHLRQYRKGYVSSMKSKNKRQKPIPDAWPTWPFTRLDPKVMAALVKKLEAKKISQTEEALL